MIEPNEFDYAILLHIDHSEFAPVEGRNSYVQNSSGYWELRARTPLALDKWKGYLEDGHLSPDEVDKKFQSALQRFMLSYLWVSS